VPTRVLDCPCSVFSMMRLSVRSGARSPVCVSGTLLFDPGQIAENAAGLSCRNATMGPTLIASRAPAPTTGRGSVPRCAPSAMRCRTIGSRAVRSMVTMSATGSPWCTRWTSRTVGRPACFRARIRASPSRRFDWQKTKPTKPNTWVAAHSPSASPSAPKRNAARPT